MPKTARIGVALLCLSAWAAPAQKEAKPAAAQEGKPAAPAPNALPRVVFVKEFPGSSPDYYAVTVGQDGTVSYAVAPDDQQPLSFRMAETLTRQIFETAARLDYFKGAQFESKKKVAAMGRKTLRYESAAENHAASFNYTENADAAALATLFEKISVTEQHRMNLERAVRFDRLGVVKQLLALEISMNKKEVVEPGQFIPLLEKIAGNSAFMNIARERAAGLLARIRSGQESAKLE